MVKKIRWRENECKHRSDVNDTKLLNQFRIYYQNLEKDLHEKSNPRRCR